MAFLLRYKQRAFLLLIPDAKEKSSTGRMRDQVSPAKLLAIRFSLSLHHRWAGAFTEVSSWSAKSPSLTGRWSDPCRGSFLLFERGANPVCPFVLGNFGIACLLCSRIANLVIILNNLDRWIFPRLILFVVFCSFDITRLPLSTPSKLQYSSTVKARAALYLQYASNL